MFSEIEFNSHPNFIVDVNTSETMNMDTIFFFVQAIWKDALQTKLKRKRFENRNNIEVQQYQLKYSCIGSGRPVKKRLGELAQKDRQKQVNI